MRLVMMIKKKDIWITGLVNQFLSLRDYIFKHLLTIIVLLYVVYKIKKSFLLYE